MKIWMIVAASLVALGLIVFVVAFSIMGFDFKELEMRKCTQNAYAVTEGFTNVSIVTDTADITILPSFDGQVRVECLERAKKLHSVSASDGTLSIALNDTRAWYDYISFFSFNSPEITVYLPSGQYGDLCIKTSTGDIAIEKDFSFASMDVAVTTGHVTSEASVIGELKIKTSTGDIDLKNLSAGSLSLNVSSGSIDIESVACAHDVYTRVSTGKINIADLTCEGLTSIGTTGDLIMENVTVSGLMSVKRDTGDFRFTRCDAEQVEITTDTGDVKGSFRTDKIVWAKTDTGRVNVPKSTVGGRCEITTDTGDIRIEIMP